MYCFFYTTHAGTMHPLDGIASWFFSLPVVSGSTSLYRNNISKLHCLQMNYTILPFFLYHIIFRMGERVVVIVARGDIAHSRLSSN